MAARKKVTKKVSKSPGRSGSNRIKRKSTRAQTKKAKSSRAAPAARAVAKKSSTRTRSKTAAKKSGAAAAIAVKAGASVKVEEKSSPKVVKSAGSAAHTGGAAKTVALKPVDVNDVKKISVSKDVIRGNTKGAESAPMRSEFGFGARLVGNDGEDGGRGGQAGAHRCGFAGELGWRSQDGQDVRAQTKRSRSLRRRTEDDEKQRK